MIIEEGARLVVSGALTVDTARALSAQGGDLLAAASREIDLGQVTSVDSAALAVVLSWLRAANAAGHTLRLNNLPATFESLVRLYALEEILSPCLGSS